MDSDVSVLVDGSDSSERPPLVVHWVERKALEESGGFLFT